MCNGDFVIHIVQDARQRCERASPDLRGRGNKEIGCWHRERHGTIHNNVLKMLSEIVFEHSPRQAINKLKARPKTKQEWRLRSVWKQMKAQKVWLRLDQLTEVDKETTRTQPLQPSGKLNYLFCFLYFSNFFVLLIPSRAQCMPFVVATIPCTSLILQSSSPPSLKRE